MKLNTGLQPSTQNGFQSLLNRRTAMQQWSVLSRLSNLRKNQEAAEIVASFQTQMEVESSTSTASKGKAA
ncbi:MAG: hypothetical protein JST89_23820 [Cyanobacteria bacterium SZAS-4]|nr:hypothetical protein [Cyanobacteria bacterium SZAS-4]